MFPLFVGRPFKKRRTHYFFFIFRDDRKTCTSRICRMINLYLLLRLKYFFFIFRCNFLSLVNVPKHMFLSIFFNELFSKNAYMRHLCNVKCTKKSTSSEISIISDSCVYNKYYSHEISKTVSD